MASSSRPRRRDDRVILHFDYDCFYAQVMQNRASGGLLAGRCVGVTQKSILATCNYAARRRGVRKLMRISEARRVCPDLVLVDGEDLSPFRDASKQLFRLVRRLVGGSDGCPVERLGLDEVFVDATSLVDAHLDRLHAPADPTQAFFRLPGDGGPLSESGFPFDATSFSGYVVGQTEAGLAGQTGARPLVHRLLLGSHLAAYLRGRLEADAGYTASAGIATSKLLAKLAGRQHKPAAQTTLLSDNDAAVLAFMDVLPLRSVTGIGDKTSRLVAEFLHGEKGRQGRPGQPDDPGPPDRPGPADLVGSAPDEPPPAAVTVGAVRLHPLMSARRLDAILGGEPGAGPSSSLSVASAPGARVWALLHGVDDSPVRPAADVPAQISIEDTYAGPRRHLLPPGVGRPAPPPAVVAELRKLAASLLRRMHVDLVGESAGGGSSSSSSSTTTTRKTWLARPRTLRLTLRPQPVDPDPAVALATTTTITTPYHSYSRASRSQPLPAFVLSLATPPAQIVDRLVAACLVPMFCRLAAAVVPPGGSSSGSGSGSGNSLRHSSSSSSPSSPSSSSSSSSPAWTVGLLNVCVANMAPVAADGDDIAALFRRQQQESAVAGCDDDALDDDALDDDALDDDALDDDALDDDALDDDALDDDGWLSSDADGPAVEACSQCGRLLPSFALTAHARYHLLGDT